MSNPTTTGGLPDDMIVRLTEQLAAEREGRKLAEEGFKISDAALAAEREVGGNTAIALAQQITKLEDQLAAAVEALKEAREVIAEEYGVTVAAGSPLIKRIDAALEKFGEQKCV